MKTTHHLLLAAVGVACLLGARTVVAAESASASEIGRLLAVARLSGTAGHEVSGLVQFFRHEKGVRVVADVTGLTPGEHGIHIHEHGDCSAPDGSSAGGHFNPTGEKHGGREAAKRHAGDLGNLTATESGTAHLDYVDTHLRVDGAQSFIGRAVIVHAGRDDLHSQPSGDAGPRVACGVIEKR
jgi:Cu-Zn family superoxide dismutase